MQKGRNPVMGNASEFSYCFTHFLCILFTQNTCFPFIVNTDTVRDQKAGAGRADAAIRLFSREPIRELNDLSLFTQRKELCSMPVNRISAALTAADRDAVLAAIKTIRQKLPFLVDLTPDERRSLPKFSNKSIEFIRKAYELALASQDFLPRGFNIDEMRKDMELYEALYPIQQAQTILAEMVDDTSTAAGAEAYSAALTVYQFAKNSNVGTAGLDEVVDTLGKVFGRKSKKSTSEVKDPA